MRRSEEIALLRVDKPSGMTSHDVVASVRRILGVRKAGHGGTLDPFATGLLVLGLGKATRLLQYILELPKEYEGRVRFGVATETQDPEGAEVARDDSWASLSAAEIGAMVRRMTGPIRQIPPAYSAIKVGGVPAHRRARRGELVKLAPRSGTIHAFSVLDWSPPDLDIRVRCSSGVYVRTLASDLAVKLGSVAHLARLRRVAVGAIGVEGALDKESLDRGIVPESAWVNPVSALDSFPVARVGLEEIRALAQGRSCPFPGREDAPKVLVFAPGERLAAIGRAHAGRLAPAKVFWSE